MYEPLVTYVNIYQSARRSHKSTFLTPLYPPSSPFSKSHPRRPAPEIPTTHHQRLGDQGSQGLGADRHRALRIYHTDDGRAPTVLLRQWRRDDKPRFSHATETSTLEVREIVGRMKLSPRGGAGLFKKCVDASSGRIFSWYTCGRCDAFSR